MKTLQQCLDEIEARRVHDGEPCNQRAYFDMVAQAKRDYLAEPHYVALGYYPNWDG